MGKRDRSKTTILDYSREAKVAEDETGEITQRVGAYQVEHNGNKITFLDTPGHEAFTAMRARGAQSTDIVILVVAADDSVMPQTLEAINHAKAAEVPIIVAINKIDKPGANPDNVRRELSEKDVLVEDWGGKIQSVPTSAKTGEGIDELMEAILLEAEVLDLKANASVDCKGTVIDSKLDKGLGPVATVLIQKGTLKIGIPFICNNHPGKVRAIMNEKGERIKEAGPSDAVQILGFDQVPQSGDILAEVTNESDLKKIANDRQRIKREIDLQMVQKTSLDSISAQIKEGDINSLNIIIKADSDGSIEALIQSLEKINNDEVGVDIVHRGVGNVSDSDVLLAQASQAVVVGFGVQIPSNTKLLANQSNVEIRAYNIIYQVVEDIKLAVEGLLRPDLVEEILGEAIVKEIKAGVSEIEIAMIGRDAMEKAIAKYHPDSELRDTWVWFQSGINTDGAHNPLTTRKLKTGDILSLNTFPMISGYYTALERTLFLKEIDDASLKAWEANVKVHRRGLELIKPGVKCSEITAELNNLYSELGYLHRRTFGYGHSFGILSHYYGREGKLELREDIETILEPNMVVSMEPMIFIPEGEPGAGGYREHDILVINKNGAEDITKFPFGPEHNIIK